jgi:hypothetical protein
MQDFRNCMRWYRKPSHETDFDVIKQLVQLLCRIGDTECGGMEDQATQTDDDEAELEPPKRLSRPTHFHSGNLHAQYWRLVRLFIA